MSLAARPEPPELEPGQRRHTGTEYSPIIVGKVLRAAHRQVRRVRFAVGDVLFQPGDTLEVCHLVLEGRVELVLEGRHSREMVLVSAGPGAYVGEDYVLTGEPSLLWAIAAEPTVAMEFDLPSLLQEAALNPETLQSVMLTLARKVETLTIRLHNVTFMPLECRIAKMLLAGAQRDGKLGIVNHTTHSEVARCTGVGRVSASRCLQRMQKAGLVELHRGYVQLPDPAKLVPLACNAE